MNWHPVMIVTTPLRLELVRLPQSALLQVWRCHLAESPDGILMASWDTPEAERTYPQAQLVGWRPERDVPFRLPVRFERTDSPSIVTQIARGAWVLPYEEARFEHYQQLAQSLKRLYEAIDRNPLAPALNAR